MTNERFKSIMNNTESEWDGDNCLKGLQIISKYTDNPVQAAEKDEIWSESIDILIDKDITEEDVVALAKLNWIISEDSLLCFV